MKLSFVVLVLALAAGCSSTPEKTVPPNGGQDCVSACVQARAVCAEQACPADVLGLFATSPNGAECESWRCQQGYPHEKNACIARATTPSALQGCKGVGR